ncbi:PaaI family thioesterase [Kribbella sp. NPDC051587]|uniref:PaaI family thioesterase n=1 Tax=Kribbella sp. NPDC051587 TaxID=3364119 RepID=UPI0037985535
MDQPTRTYAWGDPEQLKKTSEGLSGLEFLRLLASGELGETPMLATIASKIVRADEGHIELTCDTAEFMYNPLGMVHGGVAATLLDSAASCAVHTTLPLGTGYSTLDLSAHFLRPITSDLGQLRVIGTVVNRGRRTALGKAELRDKSDRLLAHATASCMLFPIDA